MIDRSNVIELLRRRGADPSDIKGLMDSIDRRSVAKQEARESDWAGGLEYMLGRASDKEKNKAKSLTARIDSIDESGYVFGTSKKGKRSFTPKFRCDADSYLVEYGCSCMKRKNTFVCEHLAAFANHLQGEMRNLDSPVREQVIAGLELTPDPSLTGSLALSMLDQFIDHTKKSTAVAEAPQEELTRILWRVTLEDEFDLDIEPVLQKAKKARQRLDKGPRVASRHGARQLELSTDAH